MRLGTCLLNESRTLQGARAQMAYFCSATVAGFYSAVDTVRHDRVLGQGPGRRNRPFAASHTRAGRCGAASPKRPFMRYAASARQSKAGQRTGADLGYSASNDRGQPEADLVNQRRGTEAVRPHGTNSGSLINIEKSRHLTTATLTQLLPELRSIPISET